MKVAYLSFSILLLSGWAWSNPGDASGDSPAVVFDSQEPSPHAETSGSTSVTSDSDC